MKNKGVNQTEHRRKRNTIKEDFSHYLALCDRRRRIFYIPDDTCNISKHMTVQMICTIMLKFRPNHRQCINALCRTHRPKNLERNMCEKDDTDVYDNILPCQGRPGGLYPQVRNILVSS